VGFIDIVPFSLTTVRPEPEPRDLKAEAEFLERLDRDWLEEFGEERGRCGPTERLLRLDSRSSGEAATLAAQ